MQWYEEIIFRKNKDNFIDTYYAALSGLSSEQVKCFGRGMCSAQYMLWCILNDKCVLSSCKCLPTVFPPECTSVDAPVTIECMSAIFINESCVVEGLHYPHNLTEAEFSLFETMSLQYV